MCVGILPDNIGFEFNHLRNSAKRELLLPLLSRRSSARRNGRCSVRLYKCRNSERAPISVGMVPDNNGFACKYLLCNSPSSLDMLCVTATATVRRDRALQQAVAVHCAMLPKSYNPSNLVAMPTSVGMVPDNREFE